MTPLIRILIADDHGLFRDGLRKLLDAETDFHVIGEVGNVSDALTIARQLKPDILLLGLATPWQVGVGALRELESFPTPVRTLLLVNGIESGQLLEALELGARGVLLKESGTELLIKGIRNIMSGQYWLSRESVSDVVGALRELQRRCDGKRRPKTFGLSPRKLQIVAAIAAGSTNKEIAERFSLSEQTVKHHLTKIFDKLGVSNRLELALCAVNQHLANQQFVNPGPAALPAGTAPSYTSGLQLGPHRDRSRIAARSITAQKV
jgi:DNA-binding NarL/FixJ family response regulator